MFMQLSKIRGKSLFGAVCREKSTGKLNILWKECCWRKKKGRVQAKREAGNRRVNVMLLVIAD